MSESSKTISCRFEKDIAEQIQALAKANGESTSDWVRSRISQAVHAEAREKPLESNVPPQPTRATASVLQAIEARLQRIETALEGLEAIKTTIDKEASALRVDRSCEADVTHAIYEDTVSRIESSCDDVLQAIERLKQSQRSHKDTLLRAIDQAKAPKQSRY